MSDFREHIIRQREEIVTRSLQEIKSKSPLRIGIFGPPDSTLGEDVKSDLEAHGLHVFVESVRNAAVADEDEALGDFRVWKMTIRRRYR